MPSLLVVQGILSTIESDAVKLGLVSLDAEGHCLLPNSSACRGRGGVLETTTFIISIVKFKMLQEVSRIIFLSENYHGNYIIHLNQCGPNYYIPTLTHRNGPDTYGEDSG